MSAEQDQRRHARLITHNDIATEEDIRPYSELSCYGKIKRYTPQRPLPALGLSFSGSFCLSSTHKRKISYNSLNFIYDVTKFLSSANMKNSLNFN